jgi:hypothetical protein
VKLRLALPDRSVLQDQAADGALVLVAPLPEVDLEGTRAATAELVDADGELLERASFWIAATPPPEGYRNGFVLHSRRFLGT